MRSRSTSAGNRPEIPRNIAIVLSMLLYSVVCSAQSPGNFTGESRPWITLDAAYGRYDELSQLTFSAGFTPPVWWARRSSFLQGTVVHRFDSDTSGPLPWRFTLLDFDSDDNVDTWFDWAPCNKSHTLEYVAPVMFGWNFGGTLLDLDRTTAAENDTRWIQARAGLAKRFGSHGNWNLVLRTHVAAGAATLRFGEAEYSSLGERASETMTGGDLRLVANAETRFRTSEHFFAGSIDAEARMLPVGFNTRRGTIGAQLQLVGRFGCSGNGGGIYLRAERQWTQIDEKEHRLDRVLLGFHLGLIRSGPERGW